MDFIIIFLQYEHDRIFIFLVICLIFPENAGLLKQII